MQDRLPFFAELEASQRASLALVVQTAVANFVEWMTDPHSNVNYTARAFELMPQDLTQRMPLRHSVDMLRVTMEFFEEVGPLLARSDEQLTALTVGILKYSRDLAFSAATAYADAAEARGSWDSRMEASVVDAVVRGDTGPELLSRAAALNWDTTAPATVVVGTPAAGRESHASQEVRDIAARHGRAALAVAAVDILNHFFAFVAAGQVEIDVRPLAALFGKETLEEKFHADGIDGSDAQGITDGAVCSRPASLQQNVFLAAEAHQIPHNKKISGKIKFFDQRQFALNLASGAVLHLA